MDFSSNPKDASIDNDGQINYLDGDGRLSVNRDILSNFPSRNTPIDLSELCYIS